MFPQSEYENFKKNVSCVTFRYKVEDVWVNGYAIKLKTVKKLPVIVYNRGGNGSYGSVGFAAMIGRLMPLANKGFIVVGSQYRGNYRKSKVKDEFGGADVQDVLTLIDNLEFLHHADLERVGLYGSSRGTMQSMMVLRERSEPFKAVVLSAGIYDLEAQLAFRPEMENVYKNRIPNYESQKSSQLKKRSAIYWSDEIETNLPILLLHGELDKRVDVSNSIKLAEKFEENGRPYKLRIFEGDDHSLTNNREAANAELLNWFANQLKIEE
jgi:dipeptidyl aminopeptidase/acylaminoacyl peptidase